MIRRRPLALALAWARAKAREATVLPPPVGTVKVKARVPLQSLLDTAVQNGTALGVEGAFWREPAGDVVPQPFPQHLDGRGRV